MTPLTEDELKDACLCAQPTIFQSDFTRSRMSVDNSDIHELLECFVDLQSLDPPNRGNHNDAVPRPTGPPLELRSCRNPRTQHDSTRPPYIQPK